uniref:Import receptor subunit TOM40 n=1 Tax=Ascaris suum TaxID=6253 RepID=F1LEM0_ASCSU
MGNTGVQLCYHHKQAELPEEGVTMRASIDTNWTVGGVFEKKLSVNLPFTLAISGLLNHIKAQEKSTAEEHDKDRLEFLVTACQEDCIMSCFILFTQMKSVWSTDCVLSSHLADYSPISIRPFTFLWIALQ